MTPYEYTFTVSPNDCDFQGHVNHATYATFFESARWQIIEQGGYGQAAMEKHGVGAVVVELKISYKLEVTPEMTIRILTEVERPKPSRFLFHQEMQDCSNSKICAKAQVLVVPLDLKTRRATMPPQMWLDCFPTLG